MKKSKRISVSGGEEQKGTSLFWVPFLLNSLDHGNFLHILKNEIKSIRIGNKLKMNTSRNKWT